jgi:hypothetical protein
MHAPRTTWPGALLWTDSNQQGPEPRRSRPERAKVKWRVQKAEAGQQQGRRCRKGVNSYTGSHRKSLQEQGHEDQLPPDYRSNLRRTCRHVHSPRIYTTNGAHQALVQNNPHVTVPHTSPIVQHAVARPSHRHATARPRLLQTPNSPPPQRIPVQPVSKPRVNAATRDRCHGCTWEM